MKSTGWALLMILILAFVCCGSFTSLSEDELQIELVYTFSGHSERVTSVAFSPDGKFLASSSCKNPCTDWPNELCSSLGKVKLWDLKSKKELRTFEKLKGAVSLAFSFDSQLLALGFRHPKNAVTIVRDIYDGHRITTIPGEYVAFSPDGDVIASASSLTNTVRLWKVGSYELQHTLGNFLSSHKGDITSLSFSPDGELLASGSEDNTVKLWEVATGREVRTLSGHTDSVESVAFSPDGKYLASGSWKTIKLWEVATGREIRTLSGHTAAVNSVAFSPDGEYLASGSWDDTIKLWEVATGNLVRTLSGHTHSVNSVAFSPDGEYLASGSSDGTVLLWKIQAEENASPQSRFTFSPKKPTDLDLIHFTDQSSDPDGKIVEWHWDFGDGDTSTLQDPSHRYSDDSTYTVSLTVTDNDRATDTAKETITVSNVPPEADFTFSPDNPEIEQVVTFDACASRDRDDTIEEYQWDWNGDGDYDDSISQCKIEHSFTEAGEYEVTLRVVDDDGDTDTTIETVTVVKKNQPPEARFSYEPQEPTDLDEIKFTDKSTDPDGEVTKWRWDFGDGDTSDKQNPAYQYEDDGTYTVKLTVVDDDGATDTTSKTITVSNVPPEATFSFSPKEPQAERIVTFNACTSRDRDGSIEKYLWDWDDDGDFEESADNCQIEHTFTTAGDYRVTLKVTDDDGDTDTISKTVAVSKANKPPKAEFTFSPTELVVDKAATFNASSSTDPDGDIKNYQWDFGDGSTGKGEKVSHTYSSEGTYQVKLTVTDDDRATNSVEKGVLVSELSPTIKEKYAIVIGINDYLHATEETCRGKTHFCDLDYAVNDAQAFYDLLIDEKVGTFLKIM